MPLRLCAEPMMVRESCRSARQKMNLEELWLQCEIPARGWIRRVSITYSPHFIRLNRKAWAWGWRSAGRLYKVMQLSRTIIGSTHSLNGIVDQIEDHLLQLYSI